MISAYLNLVIKNVQEIPITFAEIETHKSQDLKELILF